MRSIRNSSISVAIFGAGSMAQELIGYMRSYTEAGFTPMGCITESHKDKGKRVLDVQVVGNDGDFRRVGVVGVIAVGNPTLREKIYSANPNMIWAHDFSFTNYSGFDTILGEGSVVAPNTVLTVKVKIGIHCYLHIGSIINHNVEIGNFSVVSPGAVLLGGVKIGERVLIGANATILPDLFVGDGAIIGAGAVVTKNILAGSIVIGNPADDIQKTE